MCATCSDAEELIDVLVIEPNPFSLDPLLADDFNPHDVIEALTPADPESELAPSRSPPAARSASEGDDVVELFTPSFCSPTPAPAPAPLLPVLEKPASPPPERNVNPAVPGRPRLEPAVVVVVGDPDDWDPSWACESEDDASPTRDRRGGALLVLVLASCESEDPGPPPGVAEVAVREAVVVVVDVEDFWAREASDLRGVHAPVATPSPELAANCDNDGEPPTLAPGPAPVPVAASDEGGALGVDEVEVARLASDLRGGALLFAASCASEGAVDGDDDDAAAVVDPGLELEDEGEGCASAERGVVLDASPDPPEAMV